MTAVEVRKYNMPDATCTLEMPQGARVLDAGVQGDRLVVWALVDPTEAGLEHHRMVAVNTGYVFDGMDNRLTYVATVTAPSGTVWHVFDAGTIEHDALLARMQELSGQPVDHDLMPPVPPAAPRPIGA